MRDVVREVGRYRVAAAPAGDHVTSMVVRAARVASRPTADVIVAGTTGELVVAGSAVQAVVPGLPVDPVVAAQAADPVAGASADEDVRPAVPAQGVRTPMGTAAAAATCLVRRARR